MADLMREHMSIEAISDVELDFPMSSEVCLKLASVAKGKTGYPTSQLQRGLILIANGQELAEEGVGFGVPVLKYGVKTLFPGAIELLDRKGNQEVSVTYRMNLEERLSGQDLRSVHSQSLYRIKNHLADIYRRFPATRRPLAALSNALRGGFGWQTIYEYAGRDCSVKVRYAFDLQAGIISVNLDTSEVPEDGVTEVVVMNEQGARYFDTYADSSGTLLHGEAIGSWEEVTATSASFFSRSQQMVFSLPRLEGARLFRGRELTGSRLAWAGFGYSISPTSRWFAYPLKVERLS